MARYGTVRYGMVWYGMEVPNGVCKALDQLATVMVQTEPRRLPLSVIRIGPNDIIDLENS